MIAPAAIADELEVVEQLLGRRSSVRAFRPEPVPRPVIERILRAAQRTASWCNSQPWQVFVASGEAVETLRSAIHARALAGDPGQPDIAFPDEYRGVYKQRRRETGYQLYEAVGIARDDAEGRMRQTMENFRMFGAPHVAVITTDTALGSYGAIDCGGYVANFLIAAEAAGIATIPQAALARYASVLRDHFGFGDDRRVVCGISFGFPDNDHPVNSVRTRRVGIEDAVCFVS